MALKFAVFAIISIQGGESRNADRVVIWTKNISCKNVAVEANDYSEFRDVEYRWRVIIDVLRSNFYS